MGGGSPGQLCGLGRRLARSYSHAFDDSLGNTILNVQNLCSQRTPVSHKVIEKRRRDRINRCLNELGKTVPMALAKQVMSGRACRARRWGSSAATLGRDAAGLETLGARAPGEPQATLCADPLRRPAHCSR